MSLTRTGVGVLITAALCSVAAVLLAAPALGVVAGVAALVSLTAAVLVATAPRAAVSLRLDSTVVRRGDNLTALVETTALGPFLQAEWESRTALGPGIEVSGPLKVHDGCRWSLPLRAVRHGAFSVVPPALVRTDPFGLCRSRVAVTSTGRLLVRPAEVPLARTALAGRASAVSSGRGPSDDGNEFDTLRQYEPGDDIRRIHWPNSARTGEVLVRRHVNSPVRELVVLQDTAASSYEDMEYFERAVDFSASLVCSAGERGIGVHLVATRAERVWSLPAGDRSTPYDIGQAFVPIVPEEPPARRVTGYVSPLGRVARETLGRGSTTVLVTGAPSRDLLDALSAAVPAVGLRVVCLGPHRPRTEVTAWARGRGIVLVDDGDARAAAAQWTAWAGAPR
ncbi:DUF58 domain-containing protein [Streptomyces europaeiscabiei]|uniref:DUF58 domain-containing protein n=1 Tax=Streptomyces europaeiscabiei TaxID=146819 RepID=UPI0029B5DC73|nr:DUF58 domain-containing protein [Streptomyces europaeiscabiei]MDX3775961.1 DUF58 domain-containing protein [Streptomyces europaeiscabiei]